MPRYRVSAYLNKLARLWAALIDRGANGTIVGRDMRVITRYDTTTDLCGIDDHTVQNLTIVKAGGVTRTQRGFIILIVDQGAYMPNGKTVLSCGQIEHFKCQVNEKAAAITGRTPSIVTLEGYIIPIATRRGLPYIYLRPFTDQEWESLPKVCITSPKPWDPSVLDLHIPDEWYEQQTSHSEYLQDSPFDERGDLKENQDDEMDQDENEDRNYKSIDRAGIKAMLCKIIEDELDTDDEIEVDGIVYAPLTDEYECYPTLRSQRKYPNTRKGRPKKSNRTKKKPQLSKESTLATGESSDEEDTMDVTPVDDVSNELDLTSNNPAKFVERSTGPYNVKPSKKDVTKYAKFFPGTDIETLRATFDATTQYGSRGAVKGFNLRNQIVSPNPVLNVPRRHEPVATDTLYSSVPAVDDGSTAAQFFIGRRSHFRSSRPVGTSDKRFVHTLMDEIRRYGAMDVLISDNAKAQISARVKDVLRTFAIDDWQSEAYKGNQNFAERGWRDTKAKVNNLLNFSGAPADTWLLALQYVCFVQNHTAVKSLGGRTPVEWLLGYTPDISVLLQFEFWEPVYYAKYDGKFPTDSTESLGRFVGIADHVGHAMTYKILTEEHKVIHRAVVRSAMKHGAYKNRRAEAPVVETVDDDDEEPSFQEKAEADILRSRQEDAVERGESLPTIDASDLIGRTFINDPDDEGVQIRAKVEEILPTDRRTTDKQHELFRFRCKVGEEVFEKITTYNKMLEWCDRDKDKDDMYKIDAIVGHRTIDGKRQLRVKWASGEVTWQPFAEIFTDDPVSVSLYARENNLLDQDGWKRCKHYTKNVKMFARMINQARLKNLRQKPVYKYGFQVPRNHEEAMFIDAKNGNTKWRDAEKLEIDQLFEYECFDDLGKGAPIPEGYKKIPCHFVYDVKHDGRHKARMVAGGHRTSTPVDSVYSGVVSLPGIRIVTFLAELNDLELWGTDIGNAYLESYTKEKVAFVAGPEFGEKEGHTFIILKAQYGLKSSGARWHDRLFDVLTSMGFTPSKAEGDIWMRAMDGHYEYIAVYVDDLMIASKDPKSITDSLMAEPHNFKLKGTGPMSFHLGCDFFRDDDGTLCVGPRKYIERMCMQYEALFGCKPKSTMKSPLAEGDHPEMDTSDFLDDDGIQKYQSLIGVLQWTITLGRFDIATAVMTMSGFRAAPREGHLERVRRICGYLSKMKYGYIRIRTDEPDYSSIPKAEYEWAHTVYGDVKEETPRDAPKPLGRRVVLTSYVDANLYHDMVTGRSVTGVLHFMNQTPVEWFTKKQPTVEAATYGSEFIAAKQATQQILGIRVALRYLGVPVHGSTHLFGDNGSVVTSGSLPHSPLRKRHHALAYHYTREAVASDAIDFQFIPGDCNPADILSKHWGYHKIWGLLQPVLFWKGDTHALLKRDDPSRKKGSEKSSTNAGMDTSPEKQG